MADYYSELELDKSASPEEIKKAYRRLAMKYHPDRNSGDKGAEEKFKTINEAYSCLSDPQKRDNYDRFGTAEGMGAGFDPFAGAGGGFTGFSDIFEDVFSDFFGGGARTGRSRAARGNDLRYDLDMTLQEAAEGLDKEFEIIKWESCHDCSGTGSRSGNKTTCPDCGGRGQVRIQQGFFTLSRTCGKCGGSGQHVTDPCPECSGRGRVQQPRKVSVKIPPGVDTGSRLKMTGEGEPGANGGPPGDLYILINVLRHEFFQRDGDNLYCEYPLTFAEAALGASVEVPTLEGPAKLKIPAGTQPDTRFSLKGKGMPVLGSRRRGDLVVVVNLVVPKSLSQRQKELLDEFEKLEKEKGKESFTDKVRNLFAGKA